MASSTQPHPSFPTRPYSSTLHGKLPERNAPNAFSVSAHPPGRETAGQRQERERAQREAAQGGSSSNPIHNISDEQREEINEAVGPFLPPPTPFLIYCAVRPLRPRQRPKDRLPRIQSRPQSPRIRPPETPNPRLPKRTRLSPLKPGSPSSSASKR